jgi:Glycosyl transferase family 8
MPRNLIYACVFMNKNYIHLLKLALQSMQKFGEKPEDTDILIITEEQCNDDIVDMAERANIKIDTFLLERHDTIFLAALARAFIFHYPRIDEYDKILYLDTDIIVSNSLSLILDKDPSTKLCGMREGTIGNEWWGGDVFFDFTKVDKNTEAFSTCVLYFKNCREMKYLFNKIHESVMKIYPTLTGVPITLEQPFIIYTAVMNDAYDNTLLNGLVMNHPDNYYKQVISHFPIGPGDYTSKLFKMNEYFAFLNACRHLL